MTAVLITGVGGQDGALLARHLLNLGYEVIGTTRGDPAVPLSNLARLGIADGVSVKQLDGTDRAQWRDVLDEAQPLHIYALGAQSSVARSFVTPATSMGDARAFALLIEETRGSDVRILNATSGDCFGEADADHPITEATPFAPRSPYAIAKVAQAQLARVARAAEGRFVANAFLFNHESPLRPDGFVTRKIVDTARAIAAGADARLELGDVDVVRDWGWAPDYVDAMHRQLTHREPLDLVIATGRSVPLWHFVERVFDSLGLDWHAHVDTGRFSRRPEDIRTHHADPSAAARHLGWTASHDVDAVALAMATGSGC